jgi:hypothetical protein
VFENRVFRILFGPRRNEVTGGWRKLHNKELHDLYSSPNTIKTIKSRRMRREGHLARREDKRNTMLYWWESQRERPLGRPRRRWVDVRMDGGRMGWCELRVWLRIWTGQLL